MKFIYSTFALIYFKLHAWP